jgi:hypothetical protein
MGANVKTAAVFSPQGKPSQSPRQGGRRSSTEGGRTMPWEDGLGEEAASLEGAYPGHAKENLTTRVASLLLRAFENFVTLRVQLGTRRL